MLRGFLIRLTSLDGQLEDIPCKFQYFARDDPYFDCLSNNLGEATFGIIIETKDDLEPSINGNTDGVSAPCTTEERHIT